MYRITKEGVEYNRAGFLFVIGLHDNANEVVKYRGDKVRRRKLWCGELCVLDEKYRADKLTEATYCDSARKIRRKWRGKTLVYEKITIGAAELVCRWYDSGQMHLQESYLNGVLHTYSNLPEIMWAQNGTVLYERHWDEGKLISDNTKKVDDIVKLQAYGQIAIGMLAYLFAATAK